MGVLDQLMAELNVRTKAGLPSGTPSNPYYTGPGGLFGVHGLNSEIISTRVQPRGIAGLIPAVATNEMWPYFGYFTGFLDESGTKKTNVCDDAPTPGSGKSCIQTAQFGRYEYQTRELSITRAGELLNRGEFTDINIINDPVFSSAGTPGLMLPGMTNPGAAAQLFKEWIMRFEEVGVAFQNKLMAQLWRGNPANNTSGAGYQEFPGLDILIGTTKVDAFTNTSCPSLASDIKNFNYQKVDTVGGNDIVQWVTYMYRNLNWNAERMGLNPVKYVLAMRQALFYEMTAVWPCSYLTARCAVTNTTTDTLFVNANDQIGMRDSMRNGRYLLIDGEQVEVVFDDAIFQDSSTTTNRLSNTSFASDIYFLPMTYMGGRPGVYWEYYNWEGTNAAMDEARGMGYGADVFNSDGGKFLWVKKPPTNWCVVLQALTRIRLILRVPQLAARLQHVAYTPLEMAREPFPSDPYFVNGGVSTARQTPSLYTDWTNNQINQGLNP